MQSIVEVNIVKMKKKLNKKANLTKGKSEKLK